MAGLSGRSVTARTCRVRCQSVLAGRQPELTRILDFVGDATDLRCVVVCGESGIGKTAVWRATIEELRDRGHRVLVARPGEEELQGSLVGLGDLFADVVSDSQVLASDTDPFDRGRAVLRLLRELVAGGAVVLAIDDVQWLDPVSARALRYALRRMANDRLAVIATQRTVAGDNLTTVTPPEQTLEIVLTGLDDAGIRQLVAPVMATLSRPKLEWISELSAGNPMFALELARNPTSDRMSRAANRSLRSVVATRLADATPATRDLLRTVAALGAASPELLARLSPATDTATMLAEAVERHLLTMDSSMVVRCAHPLLGSVALAEMEPVDRRDLHARLVEVVTDPDERARHVALSRNRTRRLGGSRAGGGRTTHWPARRARCWPPTSPPTASA